jgi:hypothetical protein
VHTSSGQHWRLVEPGNFICLEVAELRSGALTPLPSLPPSLFVSWWLPQPNQLFYYTSIQINIPILLHIYLYTYRTYDRFLGPLSRERSLSCHTCCAMHGAFVFFFQSYPKECPPPFSFLLRGMVYFNPIHNGPPSVAFHDTQGDA